MPLPRGLARFNRVVTNRLTRPFATRLGGFAVLHHVGRKTGRSYETPLNAWRADEGVVVALTYGKNVDWLRNVQTSEESTLTMTGEDLRVGPPEALRGERGFDLTPAWVVPILKMLGVDQFVVFPILD